MAFTCLHNSLDVGDSDSKCDSLSTVIALMHRFLDGPGSVSSSENSAVLSRNLLRKCSMVEMWQERRMGWLLKHWIIGSLAPKMMMGTHRQISRQGLAI
jgi:hypothetical protein